MNCLSSCVLGGQGKSMNGSWCFKQLIIPQYSVLTRVSGFNAPAMAWLEVEVGVNRRSIPRIRQYGVGGCMYVDDHLVEPRRTVK